LFGSYLFELLCIIIKLFSIFVLRFTFINKKEHIFILYERVYNKHYEIIRINFKNVCNDKVTGFIDGDVNFNKLVIDKHSILLNIQVLNNTCV